MLVNEISSIIDELIPLYKKTIIGEYAIALAGAHAKGKADIHSDIDIFIYAQDFIPYISRKAVIDTYSDHITEVWVSEDFATLPWGGSIDFTYKGYKIETTIRSLKKFEEVVNECLVGNFKIYPETWTLNGYYNYIYLSEIHFIQPLEDPFNIISHFKERITTYPPKLKSAIINEFWNKSLMWVDNFHYKSAIERMDILYTSEIINQTIQNIVQVLFALNEKYFYGDKKIETQLKGLPFCPNLLIENIEFILAPRRDAAYLKRQRSTLKEITSQINERIGELSNSY